MSGILPSAAVLLLLLGGIAWGQATPKAEDLERVERHVATLAQEAAALCPVSDPSDQNALDHCRLKLFNGSYLKRSLARIVLWGRPSPTPGTRLKETTLTQFGAEALSG